MRLKTIHARTMQQAIELIREQMGAKPSLWQRMKTNARAASA